MCILWADESKNAFEIFSPSFAFEQRGGLNLPDKNEVRSTDFE